MLNYKLSAKFFKKEMMCRDLWVKVSFCEGFRVKVPGSTRSLLVCLSLNGKALADLSCNELNYKDYIQSSEKTQKLIAETGKGCNLREADLYGAILRWADLRGADLREADLTHWLWPNADLKSAKYDNSTQFPEGFDPVESGMKKASEEARR